MNWQASSKKKLECESTGHLEFSWHYWMYVYSS